MSKTVDQAQTVMQGFEALKALGQQAPVSALASTAKDLSGQLGAGLRGPVVGPIAVQGESAAPHEVVQAMEQFVEEAQKLPPKYEQPAFQCLSDFHKATASGTSRFLAGFVLAICLAERFGLKINVGG